VPGTIPSLSTDQVAAFVAVARLGSLRRAAEEIVITEQGLRNRLLALEQRVGVELYRKRRGLRRATQLTEAGRQFLPHAIAFLERGRELGELFAGDGSVDGNQPREVHVVASQYLILYVLIDAVRKFHAAFPHVHVRLTTQTEQQIEQTLLDTPDVAMGFAAPYEPSSELLYQHLFAMDWSLITPPRHPLLKRTAITLNDLAHQPLILFERGSTGRQHVVDAFHEQGVSPVVDMETTNTEIIVRMVEAGLGMSIVPLLPSGRVTRGRKVGIKGLGHQIRPIHSGILTRRGESLPAACRSFVEFVSAGVGLDAARR
jgi:DNA-binding transcriptional LysR family regulator